MNYEFSLDGKKVAGLVTALCMLGVLVFIAGMLVGTTVGAPDRAAQDAKSGKGPGAASTLAKNPLVKKELAALQKANPALAQGMKLANNPLIKKQLAGSPKAKPGAASEAAEAEGAPDAGAAEPGEAPEGEDAGKAPAQKGSGLAVVSALGANPLAKKGLASLTKENPKLAQASKVATNPLVKKQITSAAKGKPAPASPGGAAAVVPAPGGGGDPPAASAGGAGSAPAPAAGGDKSAPAPGSAAPSDPKGGEAAKGDPATAAPDAQVGGGEAKGDAAPPAEASDADADAGPENPALGFTVQVGAFLNEKYAKNLVMDLESRGYAPYIFKAQDAQDRTWYTVRVGDYGDKKEAAQAASDLASKEKVRTIVRPAGSF